MTWRDRIVPASIDGIPFTLEEEETRGPGRRVEVNEFSQSESYSLEDNGASPPRFAIDALLFGDDYLDRRDAIFAICATAGDHTLVHPHFGTITVWIEEPPTSRQSRSELNSCVIHLPCILSGSMKVGGKTISARPPGPIAVADTAGTAAASAIDTTSKASAALISKYSYGSLSYSGAASALSMVTKAVTGIGIAQKVFSQDSNFQQLLQRAGESDQLLILVGDPFKLSSKLQSLITYGLFADELQVDARAAYQGASALFGFSPVVDSPSDSSDAVSRMVRTTSVSSCAWLMPQINFTDKNEAYRYRDKLFTAIDALTADPTLDSDSYASLLALRVAVFEDVDERSAQLPQLIEYTPSETMPALLISYAIYGDVDHEADIVARNGISHPGFVPGGQVLEVLTDV